MSSLIACISYSAADVVIIDTQLCPFKAAVSLGFTSSELIFPCRKEEKLKE